MAISWHSIEIGEGVKEENHRIGRETHERNAECIRSVGHGSTEGREIRSGGESAQNQTGTCGFRNGCEIPTEVLVECTSRTSNIRHHCQGLHDEVCVPMSIIPLLIHHHKEKGEWVSRSERRKRSSQRPCFISTSCRQTVPLLWVKPSSTCQENLEMTPSAKNLQVSSLHIWIKSIDASSFSLREKVHRARQTCVGVDKQCSSDDNIRFPGQEILLDFSHIIVQLAAKNTKLWSKNSQFSSFFLCFFVHGRRKKKYFWGVATKLKRFFTMNFLLLEHLVSKSKSVLEKLSKKYSVLGVFFVRPFLCGTHSLCRIASHCDT